MATAKFGRVITAMITPFLEDGSVDYEGAAALAKHLVAHGSEGILVGGTTGEGATMTTEEKLKLYKTIVDAVGRNAPGKKVPVMGNIGTISTRDTILFGREAKKTGIDCALAIVPFYVKPNQEGMYQHFRAIAKHVD
ncbi:dihydrodipicolinate synthase family protein, partial [Dialister succinatiphilus]